MTLARAVRAGAVIAIFIVAWLLFAPPSLGGRSIYLITSGVSMQPMMSGGDLVIVRDSSSYTIGDIVAYEDPRHGRILHRIIGAQGDRYVVKGDNNAGPDGYQPSKEDIVGELWIHLPAVGGWLNWAGQRMVSGILLVTAAILLAGAVWLRHSRRLSSGRRTGRIGRLMRGDEAFVPVLGRAGQITALITGAIAVLSLLLALVAYRADEWNEQAIVHDYVQRGVFSYSSPAPSEIYPAGSATTGQPIYLDSMSELVVEFRYVVESDLPVNAEAEIALQAEIENEHGWSRPLEITAQPETASENPVATGFLMLDQLEKTISDVEARVETGRESPRYWITITPVVFLDGTIGEQAVHELFNPELRFLFEPGLLRIDPPADESDPFTSSVTGTATEHRVEPNQLTLAGTSVDVRDARFLSIAGIICALVAGAGLLGVIRRALNAPEPDQLAARYASKIVTLQAARLRSPSRLVEVTSFEDLLTTAEFHDQLIIHYVRGDTHFYFVQVGETVYGYRTSVARERPALARGSEALSAQGD